MVRKALLKLTKKDMEEILKATKYKLDEMYSTDEYVYLVDGDGKDASFKGFQSNINKGVTAPYKVCTVHTEQSWNEKYGSSGGVFDSWWD